MRAREFLMKDAYSFHLDASSLEDTYQQMFQAYHRIFTQLGLKFCAVLADTGSIGGSLSHEFHVLADTGEDLIAFSNESNYAANVEVIHASQIKEGDPSPDGHGTLLLKRGIEVGHIFQLGDRYSQDMKATVLDEQGHTRVMTMGCYGIGVSRIVAAAIEQNYDEKGIIWPEQMAPFQIAIIPIGFTTSTTVQTQAMAVYEQLVAQGFEVLLDDRPERPGVMFSDMDLMGIPHRFVISEKTLATHSIEYKSRTQNTTELIHIDQIGVWIQAHFSRARS
jgi:prolyl-tRNA synthetase